MADTAAGTVGNTGSLTSNILHNSTAAWRSAPLPPMTACLVCSGSSLAPGKSSNAPVILFSFFITAPFAPIRRPTEGDWWKLNPNSSTGSEVRPSKNSPAPGLPLRRVAYTCMAPSQRLRPSPKRYRVSVSTGPVRLHLRSSFATTASLPSYLYFTFTPSAETSMTSASQNLLPYLASSSCPTVISLVLLFGFTSAFWTSTSELSKA
mmetsp:Transcript_25460/g.72720  ORF Transcript_25460/g.72720 Transcript_25460/m.72720 type:complete len:207 (+) Transcript_25460:969-1589(+)